MKKLVLITTISFILCTILQYFKLFSGISYIVGFTFGTLLQVFDRYYGG